MRRLCGVDHGGSADSAWARSSLGGSLGPLTQGQVYVWTVRTDASSSAAIASRLEAVLPPGERQEALRFRRSADQQQFVMARALVRLALSRQVAVPASVWRFDRDCHGRPFIATPALVPPVRFSLSHTRGLIACLTTLAAEAAVDVEKIEYDQDLARVAQQVLSPQEQTALSVLSERDRTTRFFDHWTLKEAYAKARGLGLALTFSDIGFEFNSNNTIGVHFGPQVEADSSAWVFWCRHLSPQHSISVAVRRESGQGCEVILRPATFDGAELVLAA